MPALPALAVAIPMLVATVLVGGASLLRRRVADTIAVVTAAVVTAHRGKLALVLLPLFLTCFVALVVATALLLVLGEHVRIASRVLGLVLGVALACAQGLVRSEGVFLRTPKQAEGHRLGNALWAARSETVLAVLLWGSAAVLAVRAHPGPLLLGLLAWQGAVYASAPFMAWMNLHTKLSAQLERRRRTEALRERAAQIGP